MQNSNNNGNNSKTDILATAAASLPANGAGWYQEEYEEGVNLRDYWYVLKKRKWWVLGIMGGAVTLAILAILFMTPVWEGKITLQITQDKGSSALGSAGSSMDPLGAIMGSSDMDRFYQTQYAILHSPAIAYGLIDALKLKDHPSYKKVVKENPHDPPGVIRQKYAKELLQQLLVLPINDSYLVDVIFRSTDKKLAREVPTAVQDVYLNLCMKTRQQSFVMLKDWLDKQLVHLADKLEISEKHAIIAGQKGDFMGVDMTNEKMAAMNVVLQKYVQVSHLLTTAQSALAAKKALYEQIEQKGVDAPVIVNNPLVERLRAQLITVQGQASGSGQVFGPNFPQQKVTLATANEIKRKLDAEISRQVISIRSDYQAALKAENLLQQEFEEAKAKLGGMENGLVQYHMLQRDLQTNQALYEGLLGRMKDAAVAATMVPSNIAIINPSEEPYKPYRPRPLLYLALAVFLGAVIGSVTAFFLEYMDNSIKTVEELEKIVHIPSLGMIPMIQDGTLPKTPLETIAYFDPKSQISEAVSHIKSAIMLSASLSAPQTIVISSCNPSEGKTTSTCNMAIALSRGERKCVLIDCDLRKPGLHRVFALKNKRGLTNYLTGSATLEEIIKPTEIPDLYLIPAGPTPPNPGELLASEAFRKMIALLRERYVQIVIDSPPIIGFADARLLSSVADGVVLVFKHNSTSRESAKLAVQMLSQNKSQILGSILTMVKKDQMGYGAYYSYYKHYNKYYEAYNDADSKALKKLSSPGDLGDTK
ncbi:MAG: GumC family protein [Syntrophobacteraceae bacterium]